MKRLMWGAVLFLIAVASSTPKVEACRPKSLKPALTPATLVYTQGENTVWVTTDGDVITVVVYDNSETNSEWI